MLTTISQLTPGALIKAGGTAAISGALMSLLKSQKRSSLDTDSHLYREGDGFEFRIETTGVGSPRVTLLNGVLNSRDDRVYCYVDRVPMRGYRLKEIVIFEDEATVAKPMSYIFKSLNELSALTGHTF